MEVKFAVLFLVFLVNAERHKLENVANILGAFNNCSITYYHIVSNHFPSDTSPQNSNWDRHEISQRLIDKFDEIILQYVVVDLNRYWSKTGPPYLELGASRYSACTVTILLRRYVRFMSALTKSETMFPKIRSQFMWYLKSSSDDGSEYPYYYLVNVERPAIHLEIENLDFRRVSAVCIHCSVKGATTTSNLNTGISIFHTDITLIKRYWIRQNSDLRGASIQSSIATNHNFFHSEQSVPCSSYPDMTKLDVANHCLLILLGLKYNLTLVVNPENVPIQSYVLKLILQNSEMLQEINPGAISSHNIRQEFYAFAVFYDQSKIPILQIKVNGILAPFPWWVWICIGAMGFTTSFLLAVKMENLNQWLSMNILTNWFALTSLIVSQGAPIFGKRNDILLLWSVWAAFTLIISEAYRGFLFSSLVINVPPSTPRNLSELTESSMLILTTETVHDFTGEYSALSFMLNSISIHEIRPKQKKIYNQLAQSLNLFTTSNLIRFAELCVLITVNKSAVESTNLKKITIPNKFAIFDSVTTLERFMSNLEVLGNYWISKPVTEHRLGAKEGWNIAPNYMQPSISASIANVDQSGMFDWWEKSLNIYCKWDSIADVKFIAGGMWNSHVTSDREDKISKDVHWQILFYFGGCIAACFLIFISENIYRHISRFFSASGILG